MCWSLQKKKKKTHPGKKKKLWLAQKEVITLPNLLAD